MPDVYQKMDPQGFKGNATDNNDDKLPQLATNGFLCIPKGPIPVDGKINNGTQASRDHVGKGGSKFQYRITKRVYPKIRKSANKCGQLSFKKYL